MANSAHMPVIAKAPTTLIVRASVNHARGFGSQRDLAAPRAELGPEPAQLAAVRRTHDDALQAGGPGRCISRAGRTNEWR